PPPPPVPLSVPPRIWRVFPVLFPPRHSFNNAQCVTWIGQKINRTWRRGSATHAVPSGSDDVDRGTGDTNYRDAPRTGSQGALCPCRALVSAAAQPRPAS